MNTSERQWFKQSERPVTEADLPVWCAAPVVGCLPFFTRSTGDVIHNDLWTHAAADIPAPPKASLPKKEDEAVEIVVTALRQYRRAIDRLYGHNQATRQAVVKYFGSTHQLANDDQVRALFQPTAKPTNTEAK